MRNFVASSKNAVSTAPFDLGTWRPTPQPNARWLQNIDKWSTDGYVVNHRGRRAIVVPNFLLTQSAFW